MPAERVTLTFASKEEREWFMGQLADGFGENDIAIEWKGNFHEAAEYHIIPEGDAWEHWRRMNAKFGRQR